MEIASNVFFSGILFFVVFFALIVAAPVRPHLFIRITVVTGFVISIISVIGAILAMIWL